MALATQTKNTTVSESLATAARTCSEHRDADLEAVAELVGMESECDRNAQLLAKLRELVALPENAPYTLLLENLVSCMWTLKGLMDGDGAAQ
jgi:hypothetical protein